MTETKAEHNVCRLYQNKVNSCQGDLGRQSKKGHMGEVMRLTSLCGGKNELQIQERHQVNGNNLVRTFAAVHAARMGKLVPCHHSGAWQKPSLDNIWKNNDLKID
ncbi:hypothetical protein EMCRGX_G007909 [Ephydatia muelleri]